MADSSVVRDTVTSVFYFVLSFASSMALKRQ